MWNFIEFLSLGIKLEAFIASIASAVSWHATARTGRFSWIMLVTISILTASSNTFAITRVFISPTNKVDPGHNDEAVSDHRWNTAQAESESAVRVRWELVTDRSSLIYEKSGQDMRIFPNPRISWNFQDGVGGRESDPQYHPRILGWLRERCRALGNPYRCYLYLARNDTNLIELTFSKPAVVQILWPTPVEFEAFNAVERDIANRWLTRYVGHWYPTIRITVDNTNETLAIQVISLIYRVDQIGAFKADIPFIRYEEPYRFKLPYKTGVHEFRLAEKHMEVSVPSGGASTFDVVFEPGKDASVSPVWEGVVSLNTNRGEIKIGRLELMTYNPSKGGIKWKLNVNTE